MARFVINREKLMKVSKLFGVLVLGGSMLIGGACNDSGDENKNKNTTADAKTETADANMSLADANADGTDATTSELAPCFCDTQACCDDGTLQFGFECCWGTSC